MLPLERGCDQSEWTCLFVLAPSEEETPPIKRFLSGLLFMVPELFDCYNLAMMYACCRFDLCSLYIERAASEKGTEL